jgi:glutaminyl-peptide cyclotransferase
MRRRLALSLLIAISLAGSSSCAQKPEHPATTPAAEKEAAAALSELSKRGQMGHGGGGGERARVDAPRAIDASRAMRYVKDLVAFGPRPAGSENNKKQQNYILSKLKSDQVEQDAFTTDTPIGKIPMRNIIAKFPGTDDGIIVIASHYDTLYSVKNFVGANDGASSTALLLELANQFRGKKLQGASVWLVFFDGEEAFREWTASDSVYGSRHLAAKWQQDGTAKKIKAFILLDMIGDTDLNIDRDENSTKWLQDLVYQAASHLGYQSHFYGRNVGPVGDDHVPFAQAGVPVIDLIDFNYGYGNVFWHTPQDTIDKLSAKSLQIVGDTVIETIQLLNERR